MTSANKSQLPKIFRVNSTEGT